MVQLELRNVFADKKELQKNIQKTEAIFAQLSVLEKGSTPTGVSKELKELRDELAAQKELIATINARASTEIAREELGDENSADE